MDNIENEWTIVSYKKNTKTNITKNTKTNNKNHNNTELNNIIINTIHDNNYYPEYIFLYGSRARNTNRITSDVDLLVFWKYPVPTFDEILYLKELLMSNLKLGLDFVNMRITNKNIIVYDERTICYYNNVCLDAICIYKKDNTKNININDLLDISERIK